MTTRRPARPGIPVSAVDTPALVIDLDAFERNLDAMAAYAEAAGVRLRPHAKTHKSPDVALAQAARGAVGQCCQKVSEAEVLVHGGIKDVLVSNEIVGEAKLRRLADLATRARISVCADDIEQVEAYDAAARAAGAVINVLVEIDAGAGRCGVAAGRPAASLACAIAAREGLSFAGLQAYHGGAQHLRTPEERRAAIAMSATRVRASLAAMNKAGLACPVVTGAGTGTFYEEASSGVWNELQAGSYCFMDADYARNQPGEGSNLPRFEHALFIATTVMSVAVSGQCVIDAGHKAAAIDSGLPVVWGADGLTYAAANDEHGVVSVNQATMQPQLGSRIWLIPGHIDPTVNLHDWYVGVRGGLVDGVVEAVWPVAARGCVF
ncbi:MAG: DSD1 family PLP-dependent enzyme [Anderseniella sp.]|jgi:D-serine deaminase-like pyridoxal phosphate-dependent protein|nr:DSD1 family PLP-dependent enzyme [Anderseniella sp.]